jgi:hypothetical protein
MAAPGVAAEAKLLALAQQQLAIERQLRSMVEEEAASVQERFEHEQMYQKHCQDEVRGRGAVARRPAASGASWAVACTRRGAPWSSPCATQMA